MAARTRLGRFGTIAVTVAVLLAGSGAVAASAGATDRGTSAGAALARAALLTRSQVGRGWTATPLSGAVAPVTCPAFDPPLPRAIGERATGRFSASQSGPFVTQQAYAYGSAAGGAAVADALMRRRLVSCVAGSLTGGSTRQIVFKVVRRHGLALPGLGVAARGYRVVGTATQPEQTVAVYLDAIVLAHGQVVTELSVASFYAPPPRRLELRLERLVARRLARP